MPQATKEAIDALVGPATPHFAYQLRARIEELVKELPDDDLAHLETWARRIRGEIFFARKWLIVEGQSDYVIMHHNSTCIYSVYIF